MRNALAAGLAVHAHQSGHRLDRRVVAGQAAERAVGAEARYRAVDQPREALAKHLLVADPQRARVPGLKFSSSTSASSSKRSSSSMPSAVARSTAMPFLLRFTPLK